MLSTVNLVPGALKAGVLDVYSLTLKTVILHVRSESSSNVVLCMVKSDGILYLVNLSFFCWAYAN